LTCQENCNVLAWKFRVFTINTALDNPSESSTKNKNEEDRPVACATTHICHDGQKSEQSALAREPNNDHCFCAQPSVLKYREEERSEKKQEVQGKWICTGRLEIWHLIVFI